MSGSDNDKKINDPNPDGMIAALVDERAGLSRAAGAATDDAKKKRYTDRISQVDEQLKLRGRNAKGEPLRAPSGRQVPPQQTT
ncbi:hypothetical protein GA0074692_6802 [Micromonospora pallida]|uniref:Uncharacterized protein n=1 Tax=Micromonospora pallida TaxID=145854 RepID=A0A1C6TNE9_9ACTN|nr:hypothetical protein [Micromonospora pallida]SCL43167.1 hypothetical protein GA0074692_6744 [Micromonospora pallida]SCL43278.1 hypothetical protein GA0074692_6802 [Micromonospora pallida]